MSAAPDKIAIARMAILNVLKARTKMKPERMSELADEIMGSISHLISLNESSGKKLGAVVMTESAAIDSRIKPRQV